MIPLSAPLDNTDFDALFELARSRLPLLAREWTDYNYSDPGITLVDLLAWIADTQIYSIGRNRADERTAMAALLDIRAEGARPASGTVFARDPAAGGQPIAAGARLVPSGAAAPGLEVAADVTIWPLAIAAIRVETPSGVVDHTADNAQPRATYAPFGEPPSEVSALYVALEGALEAGAVEVSLGFELEEDDETGADDGLGGVSVFHVAPDGAEQPAAVRLDTTNGMRRSGTMVLGFTVPERPGRVHAFRFRPAEDTLIPRLLRVSPNALPVVQRATFALPPFQGTGRAGQRIVIRPLELLAPHEAAEGQLWRLMGRDGGLAFDVRVGEAGALKAWTRAQDGFGEAGPADEWFSLAERPDGSEIEIGFGNGVNGRRPPEGAQIEIAMALSAGSSGNVAGGIEWVLEGKRKVFENREALAGGGDADDLDDLLARLRTRLGSQRTLATSRQIEEAARGLPPAFGVARATVVDNWEPGRRRPASPATRTLVVARKGDGNETADWRNAIARRLRPRIALAERLIIAAPDWRRLRVRVHAVAAPGLVPADVAREIRKELADRLKPSGRKGAQWPLGQDVTAMAVGGWVRRLPGVAAVREIALLDEAGRPVEGGELKVGRGQLPLLLDSDADDIRVETGARR